MCTGVLTGRLTVLSIVIGGEIGHHLNVVALVAVPIGSPKEHGRRAAGLQAASCCDGGGPGRSRGTPVSRRHPVSA